MMINTSELVRYLTDCVVQTVLSMLCELFRHYRL